MFRTVVIKGISVRGSLQRQVLINGVRTLMLQTYRRKILHTAPYLNQSQKWLEYQLGTRHYSSNLPQHTKVVLPALSPTMEEGTLISWAKKEGDKLNEGDLLAEIETDKATMAFETPEEGYLAKILIPAGSKGVPIGKLVCIIVENEADVAAFKDFKDDSPAVAKKPGAPAESVPPTAAPTPTPVAQAPPLAATPAPPPKTSAPPPSSAQPAAQGTRVYASPMAKRLAEQRQIRLQGKGTGLFGAITSSDLDQMSSSGAGAGAQVQQAATPTPAAQPRAQVPQGAAYVDIPNSNMRTTIAKRLTQSKQSIPHFYVATEVNLDTINKLRKKINKQMEKEGVRLSVNDFIIKATAMANIQVPEANSSWMDSVIRQFSSVDVSVAVATDNGLITPIVFDASRKGLLAISKEVKSLAKKAREGKLQPQEYQGGTVTVSNLGMFDVNFFTAIINPPQSVILAVGTGKEKLIEDENSPKGFKKTTTMIVTVSCDHRVVDGVVAARWLKSFRQFIEDPITMVL